MLVMSAGENSSPVLSVVTSEIEEFVSAAGWGQPAQLFALVSTAELKIREPEMAGLDAELSPLTPIAQDRLPDADLANALASIEWPDTVVGCALAQEIVVLPPAAESELAQRGDDLAAQEFAAQHPMRTEARLIASVLRDGSTACLLRLRETDAAPSEIVTDPNLAPNLTRALLETLKSA